MSTDPRRLAHLKVGQTWQTTSYETRAKMPPGRKTALLFAAFLAIGCAPPPASTTAEVPRAPLAPLAPSALAGEWVMDLSPAQDGSYTKPFTVVLDAPTKPDKPVTTFTGTVYGGNTFSNGLLLPLEEEMAFSFVSDEKGETGGPYYFLGVTAGKTRLQGTVRSINRGFQLRWSATRAAPATPAPNLP